ncbi:MAG TPA: YbaK/EbsC family protein [Bacillota bacterium]|nr:YbaK/EbsC family protein [Bacillota bacterium]
MSYLKVKKYFTDAGLEDRILDFDESSATVELAAAAVGCEPQQIVKTMSFLVEGKPILILCAGNVRIDNPKYKARFVEKAKMIPVDKVKELVGHDVGGVCPFAIKENVTVYLDESLKTNQVLYPAAGNDQSAIELSLQELEHHSKPSAWVDVCKLRS